MIIHKFLVTEVGRLEEWYKKCRIVYYNVNKKKQQQKSRRR